MESVLTVNLQLLLAFSEASRRAILHRTCFIHGNNPRLHLITANLDRTKNTYTHPRAFSNPTGTKPLLLE